MLRLSLMSPVGSITLLQMGFTWSDLSVLTVTDKTFVTSASKLFVKGF